MMKTGSLSKEQLISRANEEMERQVARPIWTAQERLALTCRILFDAGHNSGSGLAGQITARASEPGTYYTQQLGLGFDEITASSILTVDADLNVLNGSGMANPANRFHSWIYDVRPDVNCIIHTHPLYASSLSMLEVPLEVSHMDGAILYGQVAFLKDWPGVPVGNEEGEIISAALKDKRAILLSHHGLLIASSTIEEACVMSLQFERAAQMQLLAMAAGKIQPIRQDLGEEANRWISSPKRSEASFSYHARRALDRHPNVLN